MRRIVDEPERRHEIEDGLRDLYKAMSVTVNPIPVKTALNMIGMEVGRLRLPMVDASDEERAVIRAALERHNLLAAVCHLRRGAAARSRSCRWAGSARSART